MNVNGVSHSQADHPQVGRGNQKTTPEAAESATASTAETTQKQRGVIRNLLDGHFKGVADVRLRINFAAELDGIAQARSTAAAEQNSTDLLQAVETVVNDFLAAPDLPEDIATGIQDLQTAFNETAAAFVEGFAGDTSQLVVDIEAAFEDFFAGITSLLAEPEEAAAPVEEGEPESAATEVNTLEEAAETPQLPEDYQAFVDALREAFAQTLEDFTAALQAAANPLPPLSEPNGNGVAYEKFLAILESLSETIPEAETTPVDDIVDLDA